MCFTLIQMGKCKIIVVIPMYNAALTICNTINSVLCQKYVDFQIVVVDHGSNDGSYSLIKNISDKVKVIRLKRKKNELKSASRPLNEGIRWILCEKREYIDKNTFFIRLDADDMLMSDIALYQLVSNYSKEDKIINGKMCFFDPIKKVVTDYGVNSIYKSKKTLLRASSYSLAHHATLIAFVLLEQIMIEEGYCYDEKIGYGEDFDLSLRVIKRCRESEMKFCDSYIILKRLDGNTITNMMKKREILKDHIIIFSKHKNISGIFKMKVYLWFLIEMLGKIGRLINDMRKPPAYKYANINELPYTIVEEVFQLIDRIE